MKVQTFFAEAEKRRKLWRAGADEPEALVISLDKGQYEAAWRDRTKVARQVADLIRNCVC